MPTDTIGTGGDFSDWATWEAAIDAVPTEPWIGQQLAEQLAISATITIQGHTTSASNYVEMTAVAGGDHLGVSNAVSGVSNSRINGDGVSSIKLLIQDEHVRVNALELVDFGGAASDPGGIGVQVSTIGAGGSDIRLERLLIHNDAKNDDENSHGINFNDVDAQGRIANCAIWGFGGHGITVPAAAANTVVYNNTCVGNGRGSAASPNQRYNFNLASTNVSARNNMALAPSGPPTEFADFNFGTGVDDGNNVSSDASGSEQTSVDEIINNPGTTTGGDDTDIRLNGTDPDSVILDVAQDLGADFIVDISGGTRPDGAWDVGADEFFDEGGEPGPFEGEGSRPWSYIGSGSGSRPWTKGEISSRPHRHVAGARRGTL